MMRTPQSLSSNLSNSPKDELRRIAGEGLARNPSSRQRLKRFFFGFDFGTTYSSCSFSIHEIDEDPTDSHVKDIKHIRNWPNACGLAASPEQVPTLLWWPKPSQTSERPKRTKRKRSEEFEVDALNANTQKRPQIKIIVSVQRFPTEKDKNLTK